MTPEDLRALAEDIAREAGAQLLEAFAGPVIGVSTKSSPTDLVSEADEAAQELIFSRLLGARPDCDRVSASVSMNPGCRTCTGETLTVTSRGRSPRVPVCHPAASRQARRSIQRPISKI